MRLRGFCFFCAFLTTGCSSTSGSSPDPSAEPLPKTQVVFRQYHRNSPIFVVENLAGRDVVALRSKPTREGSISPAYVPDDVMARMLAEFRKFGYFDHAGARPGNPISVGGLAELTIIGANGRTISIVRRKGQGKEVYDAYEQCRTTLLYVHKEFAKYQAVTGDGGFGVKKAEFAR